ncbi:hypothetical protein Toce_0422 [Thermosediminibacter oceani DSM 16646]|uniref:Uncharacterized protein n=1 Tax=Thermosediminibacter oceani (strain ATCC BAA-1034 / DSM 16646 / JW/IW-1228P) TaxID=555079 RepID=D9S1C3_THEOJ|nr:hypothetical protein Toce_0422 [Thermosediminibacter oceani DSM 16646]
MIYNPYENAWNLMKQMAEEYMREKNYLTSREFKYIIRLCEKSINMFTALSPDDTTV